MEATNGYISIKLIVEDGETYIETYQGGKKFGRKKIIKFNNKGDAYFMLNGIRMKLNEFVRNNI